MYKHFCEDSWCCVTDLPDCLLSDAFDASKQPTTISEGGCSKKKSELLYTDEDQEAFPFLSALQVLFQRHVPDLPGNKWPKKKWVL